ncbi:S-Ena type endospore appendage [Peribacillus alkalitolerans]|uniref:S-Ena type endospore appendage n=1 Tax=Peribacillus alkalitolerans TaxID=1550385 RepID=UPI0013D68306|nr:S-Ena type endospore appendage [Peribacillus alkalitolerans]
MCGNNGSSVNGFCCPDPKIFQEEICGNIQGPVRDNFWQVLDPIDSDYFQGTFEVFNCGNDNIEFAVFSVGGTSTGIITVTPGNTRKVSVNNPIRFAITTPPILGDNPNRSRGKFCITLYKRVFC